jgi:uncharacterized DUF497 family protein
VLFDPLAMSIYDEAHSQEEARWFTLGRSSSGKVLAVSHTYQADEYNLSKVRIISASVNSMRVNNFYKVT